MATSPPPSPEVLGGFRRILARLDVPTRRAYCCSALEAELSAARERLRACAAALAQARQVEDATRQLAATAPGGGASRAASPSAQALLAQLEALQARAARRFSSLGELADAAERAPPTKRKRAKDEPESAKDEAKRARTDARAVVRELEALLEEERPAGEAAEQAVALVRRFLALLPARADRHVGFWRERLAQRVVRPAVQRLWLPKDVPAAALEQRRAHVAWLGAQLRSAGRERPHLAAECSELAEESESLLAKRERQDARRRGKEASTSASQSASTSPRLPVEGGGRGEERAEGEEETRTQTQLMPIHEVRATLARCTRETRQARDRAFELPAFDAGLKRLVDVTGAVSRAFSYDDCAALTDALLAMVEQVERLADASRRRDRLVCLQSLLQLLVARADLPLSSRRRASAREYLHNCQQSIRLLDAAATSADGERQQLAARGKPTAASSHTRFG